MIGGCRGARARRGGASQASAARTAGVPLPATERWRRTQAPLVAPVAAGTTGFCPAIDTALVDEGRNVFERDGGCYACHGLDGRGSGVAPGLRGSVWLDIDGSYLSIAQVVQYGVVRPRRFPVPMPAKGGARLDGKQVCAVAAYVFSLSH
ncbi:MAG: c-type cytochrome [Gemmatimonadota bacterium]